MENPRTIACAYCGTSFTQTEGHQKYCSTDCKNLATKEKHKQWEAIKSGGPVIRKCSFCGKEFKAGRNNQIYCSVRCNTLAGVEKKRSKFEWKTEMICKNCCKPFVPNTKFQKFCSLKCKYTWSNAHKEVVEKICHGCGKRFKTKMKDQKYCSVSCSTAHSVPTRILRCADCGKEFTHTGRSYSRRCPECNRLHWSVYCVQYYYKIGKDKKYYKTLFNKPVADRFAYRKICYSIWPRKCVICGEDYIGKRFQLDVHHIDCDPTNDRPENLIPLCRTCHRRLHMYSQKNNVPIEQRLFEIWPNGRQKIGAAVQQWTASHTANSVNAKPCEGHANTELS